MAKISCPTGPCFHPSDASETQLEIETPRSHQVFEVTLGKMEKWSTGIPNGGGQRNPETD